MPTTIPPGRAERFFRCLCYATIGALGVWALFQDHDSSQHLGISHALGHALTIVWSLMVITAIPAAGATVMGRYRVEYACLPWFITALILAAAWVWCWVGEYPTLVGYGAMSTALCFQLVTRYLNLQLLIRRGAKLWTSP